MIEQVKLEKLVKALFKAQAYTSSLTCQLKSKDETILRENYPEFCRAGLNWFLKFSQWKKIQFSLVGMKNDADQRDLVEVENTELPIKPEYLRVINLDNYLKRLILDTESELQRLASLRVKQQMDLEFEQAVKAKMESYFEDTK